MKKMNKFRYIKLVVMFIVLSISSFSVTNVSTFAQLQTALANASESLIVLTANITMTSSPSVPQRTSGNLTIDGGNFTLTRAKMSGLTLLDGSTNQNLTIKNLKSTGDWNFSYENAPNSRWNILLDGTNNISASFEVLFRSDDSTSSFTALPGSTNTITGTAGTSGYGLLENYGISTFNNSTTTINTIGGTAFFYGNQADKTREINVINGGTLTINAYSAIVSNDVHDAGGLTDTSKISVNVTGTGSKLKATTSNVTFNAKVAANKSDINLLASNGGVIEASTTVVSGVNAFNGGKNPSIVADNGTITLSSTGTSRVVNIYDRAGKIEAKNNGTININAGGTATGVSVNRMAGYGYPTTDVVQIHSLTGGDINITNTNSGKGVQASGDGMLNIISEDSGSTVAVTSVGSAIDSSSGITGTEIAATNSGKITLTSSGASTKTVTTTDTTNDTKISALNGGQIEVNNNGSGDAVGMFINNKPVNYY